MNQVIEDEREKIDQMLRGLELLKHKNPAGYAKALQDLDKMLQSLNIHLSALAQTLKQN